MAFLRWLIGGLIGAAIGVAIWVLVGYFGHREVGWIAWVVGFLAGVGVRYAAYLNNEDASVAKGALASLISIGAILLAKFIVFSLITAGQGDPAVRQAASQIRIDDESMIAEIATDLADEATNRGEKLAWPPGKSADSATRQADFPPSIWRKAQGTWNQLGESGKREKKAQRLMLVGALQELGRKPSFSEAFALWDILWFGLAVVIAYKVGEGSYGSE